MSDEKGDMQKMVTTHKNTDDFHVRYKPTTPPPKPANGDNSKKE